jgi:hypothetical protein
VAQAGGANGITSEVLRFAQDDNAFTLNEWITFSNGLG